MIENLGLLINRAEELGCKTLLSPKLRDYTTFRIGGNAAALFELDSEEKCRELIPFANKNFIPFIIIGKGSNILACDEGINSVVFHINGEDIKITEKNKISCFSGTALVKLCGFAQQNGFSGLEFAYGIPGSVGGAVYMNAGAYGGEMKDIISSVKVMGKDGNIRKYSSDELSMSYRKSRFSESGEIILSAEFALKNDDPEIIKTHMQEFMKKRRDKQPLEYPSAGSTFKRPDGAFAAQLIEECGLKGLQVGGAQVSEKHSGFVVNRGNATFKDVMELVGIIQKTVEEKTGYSLECEPIIISNTY